MNELINFSFENMAVAFEKRENGQIYINATQMAQKFNKQPFEFLRLPSTVEYTEELKKVMRENPVSLVEKVKGNYSDSRPQGTWMHRRLALRFAQWLSPQIAIWVDERIEELLQYGFTATSEKAKQIFDFYQNAPKNNYNVPNHAFYELEQTISNRLASFVNVIFDEAMDRMKSENKETVKEKRKSFPATDEPPNGDTMQERFEIVRIKVADLSRNAFAKSLSMSAGNYDSIITGKIKQPFIVFKRMQKAYPTVNVDWVKTGNGEILK